MPRHHGDRGLGGARFGPSPARDAGPLIARRLHRLRAAVHAALDPLVGAGRPALAGAGGALDPGAWVGLAASTETPDRPVSPPALRWADNGASPAEATQVTAAGLEDLVSLTDSNSSMMDTVAQAQAGNAEAFGVLYDHYVDLVYRYTYYRVGNRALAEDLTSETFIRALRRITSFTWQGRDFGAWLVTISRNLIADHYKSARFRLESPTADLLGAGADRPAAGPEAQVLESLTNAALLDAVRQLGPDQQECIVLRFLEGMSVQETALAMGRKPGAVKALQYRAVRSLERLLPEGLEW